MQTFLSFTREWGLLIVGLITAFFIGWQSLETKRSAKATQRLIEPTARSANAALLNAQAVINSERPWITVRVIHHPELANGFFLRITNKGRTPAHLISAYREQIIIDLPDHLPIPPKFSSVTYSPEDLLIVPDGIWNDFPVFNPESIISHPPGSRQEFENAAKFLCFYGQITYRDTFGKRNGESNEHYTRWCYVYDVFRKRMMVGGPLEYREKT